MRTVDFVGRNYICLVLPAIDITQMKQSCQTQDICILVLGVDI